MTVIFFVEIAKKSEKILYQMKVGIKLGKVKKFGIGWCIPHRMAEDNAEDFELFSSSNHIISTT